MRRGIGIAIALAVAGLWIYAFIAVFTQSGKSGVSAGYQWRSARVPVASQGPFSGLFGPNAIMTTSSGTVLVAGDDPQLVRSTDDGRTWQRIKVDKRECWVNCLATDREGALYAGTGRGLYRSTDDGKTWTIANHGLPVVSVYAIAADRENRLLLGTSQNGAFLSDESHRRWKSLRKLERDHYIQSLAVTADGSMFYGPGNDGLFRSTDGGQRWQCLRGKTEGAYTGNYYPKAFPSDKRLYAFANVFHYKSGKGSWREPFVLRSSDNGQHWERIFGRRPNIRVNDVALDKRGQILLATTDGILVSNDSKTWHEVNTGVFSSLLGAHVKHLHVSEDGKVYAVASRGEVFIGEPTH